MFKELEKHDNCNKQCVVELLKDKIIYFMNAFGDMIVDSRIDTMLPAKQKCAYFIVGRAFDSNYPKLKHLLLTCIMQNMCNYANNNNKCSIPVNFYIDAMPAFKETIRACKRKNIKIIFPVLHIHQMIVSYPDSWHEILDNCEMIIFSWAGDDKTNSFINERMGNITSVDKLKSLPMKYGIICLKDKQPIIIEKYSCSHNPYLNDEMLICEAAFKD